jgi:calcineurin-like phosphoesterase family protein
MQLRSEHRTRLEQRNVTLRAAAIANPALGTQATGVWMYLQQCEAKLITLMSGGQPPDSAPGDIDMGPVLYLLHQLPSWAVDTLNMLGMPPTAVTPAMIASWETVLSAAGVVGSDGTLVAEQLWATFDPGWAYAAFEYLIYYLGVEPKAPFATRPATIQLPNQPALKIAIVGDWGTGVWQDGSAVACPSAAVMAQIQAANPDVVIHLGDVYYAGTAEGVFGVLPGEETENLVDAWPDFPLSFTLNSNHEMYNGANGYFTKALTSAKFSKQNGTSYFALEYNDWILFGLDSSYYDPSPLYMQGALTDSNQIAFLQSFNLANKRIVVMTHHNGLRTDGQVQMGLWNQVVSALGRAPDYWYWGHVHNGIVYSAQSASGANTSGRCCGHGALPFGNAYELHDSEGNPVPQVDYYAHTPMSNPDTQQTNRVLNGYAIVTLTATSISEAFYDQSGALAWSSDPHANATTG